MELPCLDMTHNNYHISELNDDAYPSKEKILSSKSRLNNDGDRHIREMIDRLTESNERLQYLAYKLKSQLDKLHEADLVKSEFISMITHELKAPLVPIQGYCELLLDGTLGDLTKEQREKVRIMHDSTLSLSQLIQDLLDVHKLELGQMKFYMCETSAKALIERTIKRFECIAEKKKIKLLDRTVHDIRLTCDPGRILQVLNNLVGNAIKFVRANGGIIEVCAIRDNDYAVFSVKDNGIGMPREKRKNLFNKFYQVDSSLRRNAGGSGLGLAICQGIVEAHKGRIWVESVENRGTTFYFSIPITLGL